jgi:DNA-directed RNA polymerase subunit RPC12/RpoP
VGETIKCVCSHCGAKYRLPIEAQGRTARCKRCGEKFAVPRQQSLEDSILTWLTSPDEEETAEATPSQPKIISMPTDPNEQSVAGRRFRGTIRMKEGGPKQETA